MAYDAVIPNFPSIANVTFNATKSELKKKSYQYETYFSEGSLIKKKVGICLLCFAFFKDKISFFFVKKKKGNTTVI